MNFLNDIKNHIAQLVSAGEHSLAAPLSRLVATVVADPIVIGAAALVGFFAGLLVAHL